MIILKNDTFNKLYENCQNQVTRMVYENECDMILKEYGIYEMFLDESINEAINLDSTKDKEDVRRLMGRLKVIIPALIKRLVKIGAKESVLATIKTYKAAIKFDKNHNHVLREMFFALLMLAVGMVGNEMIHKYNENPVEKGTQIQYDKQSETMTVTNEKGENVLELEMDGQGVPQVVEENDAETVSDALAVNKPKQVQKQQVSKRNADDEPIRMLKKGERKITNFKPSAKIVRAIAETEKFVDHIYDAGNPRAKVTKKDMLNMKKDITCCYGHALTVAERKAWSPNKKFTKAEGHAIFAKDLNAHAQIVNMKLEQLPWYKDVQFSQNAFDGILSTFFNVGAGKITGNATRLESEFWRTMQRVRTSDNGKHLIRDIDFAFSKLNNLMVNGKNQAGVKTRRRNEYLLMTCPLSKLSDKYYHLMRPTNR